jgi:transcriptional regulator with XRE-family HTH domain
MMNSPQRLLFGMTIPTLCDYTKKAVGFVFYDIFFQLCQSAGIKPYKFSLDTNIGQPTISMWKKTGATPQGDTLQKMADYFDVPVNFLLGAGPFSAWEYLNAHRGEIVGFYASLGGTIFFDGDPENWPLTDYISFIESTVESIQDGGEDGVRCHFKERLLGLGPKASAVHPLPGQPQAAPAGADAEVRELLEHYRSRPELRVLFDVTRNASAESIRRAAAIIELLEKKENE